MSFADVVGIGLDIIGDVLQLVPAPGLHIVFGTLRNTWDMVQQMQTQRSQATALVSLEARITKVVNNKVQDIINKGGDIPESMYQSIDHFQDLCQSINIEMDRVSRMSFMKQLINKTETAEIMSEYHHKLDDACQLFIVESNIDIAASIERDHIARIADSEKLDTLLWEASQSEQRLLQLLSLHQRNQQTEMAEIKDLLHLCCRQIEVLPRGKPDRAFYEATFRKMNSMSGGKIPKAPGWIVSPLEITLGEVIGQGAYSTVHLATWSRRTVAVKVLIEGITEKVIMQEAEVWRKLSHPNIHNFLRACPSGPTPLLMSEYHKNGSACKYLEEHGNDEPGVDRLGLILDIAMGMQYLHAQNCMHGDLKGTNVLVDDNGRARISDFGFSRSRKESNTLSLRRGNKVPSTGTLRWMSPEMLVGGILDSKVDIYAFGMTCYIQTDQLPFGYVPDDQIFNLVVDRHTRPTKPNSFSNTLATEEQNTAVWRLMERCWTQEPRQRPEFTSITAELVKLVPNAGSRVNGGLESVQEVTEPDDSRRRPLGARGVQGVNATYRQPESTKSTNLPQSTYPPATPPKVMPATPAFPPSRPDLSASASRRGLPPIPQSPHQRSTSETVTSMPVPYPSHQRYPSQQISPPQSLQNVPSQQPQPQNLPSDQFASTQRPPIYPVQGGVPLPTNQTSSTHSSYTPQTLESQSSHSNRTYPSPPQSSQGTSPQPSSSTYREPSRDTDFRILVRNIREPAQCLSALQGIIKITLDASPAYRQLLVDAGLLSALQDTLAPVPDGKTDSNGKMSAKNKWTSAFKKASNKEATPPPALSDLVFPWQRHDIICACCLIIKQMTEGSSVLSITIVEKKELCSHLVGLLDHKHPAAIRSGAFAALANLAYADQIQAQPLRQGAAIKGYIDLLMTCDEDTADTILSSILRLARMDQNRQTAGTLSPGREKKAPMVPLANYPDSLRIYKVCSVMLSVMLRHDVPRVKVPSLQVLAYIAQQGPEHAQYVTTDGNMTHWLVDLGLKHNDPDVVCATLDVIRQIFVGQRKKPQGAAWPQMFSDHNPDAGKQQLATEADFVMHFESCGVLAQHYNLILHPDPKVQKAACDYFPLCGPAYIKYAQRETAHQSFTLRLAELTRCSQDITRASAIAAYCVLDPSKVPTISQAVASCGSFWSSVVAPDLGGATDWEPALGPVAPGEMSKIETIPAPRPYKGICYVDHNSKSATLQKPRPRIITPGEQWERYLTPSKKIYYFNRTTGSPSWSGPM